MLAESGCNMVRMGIESGDEFIRNKVMKKQLDDKKIWQVVRLLKKYKIKMTAYYILGAPNETKKSIQKTLSMAKKIDGERTAYFIFKPLTKESIELIKKYGGKINQRKSEKADNLTFDAVLDNKELSAAQIERYQIKAYLSTFPRRLWKLIKKDKLRYFSNLIKYLWRGKKHGLDFKYLISYFHIYGYNNIYE
jgi:magnesium-protoporphyrin IX monomethyl ester (oxidative) cyclase